jgi:hypothetical protein
MAIPEKSNDTLRSVLFMVQAVNFSYGTRQMVKNKVMIKAVTRKLDIKVFGISKVIMSIRKVSSRIIKIDLEVKSIILTRLQSCCFATVQPHL